MQGHYFFESDLFFLANFTSAIALPNSLFLLILFLDLFAVFICKWLDFQVMHPTSSILLPMLLSLVNYMKHNEPLGVWKRNCKRWRFNKLGHLLLSMMGIIHIDLPQELLQMILAVKKTIGEGELHPNFMDIDITTDPAR